MIRKHIVIALLGLTSVIALISCATPSSAPQPNAAPATQGGQPSSLKSSYSELEKAGGKVYALDPKTSAVRIYAFRGGLMSKVGHNHVLSAPSFTGFAYIPPGKAANARFDLEFRLDELELDNPEYRSGLGKAFAAILRPVEIAGTRSHMLGEENLQADRFPYVRVHSLQITGEIPKLAAQVQVELHGQQRELWVPLNVEGLPEHLVVTGSFILRQTDFGIRPYALPAGQLSVKDELVIEFKLAGT
ncbi:MAG TPA: YceI family protein [Gallionella sp.]|nr:YceI family protein [Gallionella sp.]